MAGIETLALRQVLSVLAPTYRSLDLRLVLARVDRTWTLAAGIVAATNSTQAAVKRQHALIWRRRPQSSRRLPFRIVLDVLPGEKLPWLLDSLQKQELVLHELAVRVQADVHDGRTRIRRWTIAGSHRTLPSDDREVWRFPRYGRSIQGSLTAEQVLADAKLSPADLQIPSWSHLNPWLGFDMFDMNGRSAANLELSFPIYAMLDDIPVIHGSVARIHGRAHGGLQGSLVAHWSVSRNSSILETGLQLVPRPTDRSAINEFDLERIIPEQFTRGDHISFQLYHSKLGAIGQGVSQSYSFLHGVFPPDPLRRIVEFFDGGKNASAYLRNQRKEKQPTTLGPFESAVTWLLTLMEIRSVPLMFVREAENLRSGAEWRGSSDVIAHHPNLGVLLLDCTRTVPDAVKADQIRETARYLVEQADLPIRAAIVAPMDLHASRAERAEQGVAIVDGQDLQDLLSLTTNGNPDAARNYLGMLLDRVPRRDLI